MTVEEIEQTLRQRVAAITSRDPAAISPDAPFHEQGIDSLGLVEILVFIEQTYNLQLISAELTKKDFESIHLLARLVAARI